MTIKVPDIIVVMPKYPHLIAVSIEELQKFGCPHCGYRSGYTPVSCGETTVWTCGSEDCGKTSCVLDKGVTKSTISFGNFFPELQDHPRRGIPSHGQPDKKPIDGGDFFHSRGIGLDNCTCFVCGTQGLINNIAAFVQCKEAGKRVVALFSQGARLDYRDFEPDRVQVKVGACNLHLANLRKLDKLTKDGVITVARINKART